MLELDEAIEPAPKLCAAMMASEADSAGESETVAWLVAIAKVSWMAGPRAIEQPTAESGSGSGMRTSAVVGRGRRSGIAALMPALAVPIVCRAIGMSDRTVATIARALLINGTNATI